MNLRHLCTPVDFKCLLMRECRPAPTESEHVSKCATSDAREPHLQLLDGFAGRIGLKRRNTPAFPQVGGANGEQPPPKTAQKSRTHGEIGAHFLRNPPEVAGGATVSKGAAAVSADAGAHPALQGPARRQGHSNRQRRQRMGLRPLLGRVPAQRVAISAGN